MATMLQRHLELKINFLFKSYECNIRYGFIPVIRLTDKIKRILLEKQIIYFLLLYISHPI